MSGPRLKLFPSASSVYLHASFPQNCAQICSASQPNNNKYNYSKDLSKTIKKIQQIWKINPYYRWRAKAFEMFVQYFVCFIMLLELKFRKCALNLTCHKHSEQAGNLYMIYPNLHLPLFFRCWICLCNVAGRFNIWNAELVLSKQFLKIKPIGSQ